jgi:hypothetical protein
MGSDPSVNVELPNKGDSEFAAMNPVRSGVPIYVSRKTFRNLWQDYRVYADRVELRCWIIFSTLVIRPEDILSIEVPPRRPRRLYWWALKLDLAQLFEHVELQRKTGLFRTLLFTPDNPAEFVAACRSIIPPS